MVIILMILCAALLIALICVLIRYRRLAAASSGTQEELKKALSEGHEQGVIDQTEAEMITNIFEFSEKEAQDIMTHRGDIIALDREMKLDDAVRFMLEAHNSRFPVYEDNIDHIIGIVHLKDAVRCREQKKENGSRTLRELSEDASGRTENGSLLRLPLVIPETKNVDALFRQMQSSKAQMAVVIDEYGQTAGLLTMEDILEEIVGNIMDEYDTDERYIQTIGGAYIMKGLTPLEMITDLLGIEFEGDFDTLNGYLISRLDHIPKQNEGASVDVGGYTFRIIGVADNAVSMAKVTKITAGPGKMQVET